MLDYIVPQNNYLIINSFTYIMKFFSEKRIGYIGYYAVILDCKLMGYTHFM